MRGFIPFIMGLVLLAGLSLVIISAVGPNNVLGAQKTGDLKSFNSFEEISLFLSSSGKKSFPNEVRNPSGKAFSPQLSTLSSTIYEEGSSARSASADAGMPSVASTAPDYSTTNVQVDGVDEADRFKTDGKYIYTLSGSKIVILDAYPADEMKILSVLDDGAYTGFFINGDKLVAFGTQNFNWNQVLENQEEEYEKDSLDIHPEVLYTPPEYYPRQSSFIKVFDVSDRTEPELVKKMDFQGNYVTARMIGDRVYSIFTERATPENPQPVYAVDDELVSVLPQEINYFDYEASNYQFTTIIGFQLSELRDKEFRKIVLMGSAQNLFVSKDNAFVTYTRFNNAYRSWETEGETLPPFPGDEYGEYTEIHKFSLGNEITYEGSGEVPGHVLNQFSMDEFDGYFRIATTVGQVHGRRTITADNDQLSSNNLYVLDDSLRVVGELEGLARGEKIYSARFMGKRAYLVTFKKVDPLFVIDLSDARNPQLLGKLKIPGYSDYLHPYDETHLIGLGKDAIPDENGDFAWFQGVKLSLFDVSDVENPREVDSFSIGDRGSDSYALHDHKAFLFDRDRNLLVVPVRVAEINEGNNGIEVNERNDGKRSRKITPQTYGQNVFQGAFVFDVDENGFTLEGKISHAGEEERRQQYGGGTDVIRSAFIRDTLYTISENLVKANDLDTLENEGEVKLPAGNQFSYPERNMGVD